MQCILGWSAARKSANLHFTECRVFLFDQALLITEDTVPSSSSLSVDLSRGAAAFHLSFGRVISGSASHIHREGVGGSVSRLDSALRPRTPRLKRTPVLSAALGDREEDTENGSDDTVFSVNHPTSHSYSGIGGGRSPGLRRAISIRRNGSQLGSLEAEPAAGPPWHKFSWTSPHDPFKQSSYKFLHSVKVNRMSVMVRRTQLS